jgi:hypothetical protein
MNRHQSHPHPLRPPWTSAIIIKDLTQRDASPLSDPGQGAHTLLSRASTAAGTSVGSVT